LEASNVSLEARQEQMQQLEQQQNAQRQELATQQQQHLVVASSAVSQSAQSGEVQMNDILAKQGQTTQELQQKQQQQQQELVKTLEASNVSLEARQEQMQQLEQQQNAQRQELATQQQQHLVVAFARPVSRGIASPSSASAYSGGVALPSSSGRGASPSDVLARSGREASPGVATAYSGGATAASFGGASPSSTLSAPSSPTTTRSTRKNPNDVYMHSSPRVASPGQPAHHAQTSAPFHMLPSTPTKGAASSTWHAGGAQPTPDMAVVPESRVCPCGNVFMTSAIHCRKCGAMRPAVTALRSGSAHAEPYIVQVWEQHPLGGHSKDVGYPIKELIDLGAVSPPGAFQPSSSTDNVVASAMSKGPK